MIGRAEMPKVDMWLELEAPFQLGGNARLADAGFARNQHDLAVTHLGVSPAAQQQVGLFFAADQWGQRRTSQCLETARNGAWSQHLPSRHWRGETLHLDSTEIPVLEEIAGEPAGA